MIRIYRTHDVPLEFNVDNFREMKMDHICFHRCLLNNFDMSKVSLIGCDFRSAELIGSDFFQSCFDESKLIMVKANSNFDHCTFKTAWLLHSDFSCSSFRNADFSDSLINDTNFSGCDLRGANMTCKGLENCTWKGAIYDDSTLWGDKFKVDEYGAVKV